MALYQLAKSSPGKLSLYQLVGIAKLLKSWLGETRQWCSIYIGTPAGTCQVPGYPSEMAAAGGGTGAGVANAWFFLATKSNNSLALAMPLNIELNNSLPLDMNNSLPSVIKLFNLLPLDIELNNSMSEGIGH
ncbi:hypothetical protein PCASD_15836 [Puccinia coronata f. sp. avenae]|uniref:Uncharacterized protein n=1 Tax=Puccinia coronata f. sp. avenae TaxID=200324 RepID=A0A2N5T5W3_9BASI|nr:hypothetical protein PCASD_15836 [Puccinia coronata f. sp. avenae]